MRTARTLRIVVVVALLATTASVAIVRSPTTTAAPGNWSTVRAMGVARTGHTTTVVGGAFCNNDPRPALCGKVLVTGGRTRTDAGREMVSNTVEVYDPAERTWASMPPMAVPRWGHTANLLSGAIGTVFLVVVGGETVADPCKEIELLGSACRESDADRPTSSVEGLDLTTGVWAALPPMSAARVGHSATELPKYSGGSKLVVVGGTDGDGPVKSAEMLSNATSPWVDIGGPMSFSRTGHTATPVRGPNCVFVSQKKDLGACNLLVVGGTSQTRKTELLLGQRTTQDSTPPAWCRDQTSVVPGLACEPELVTARSSGHTANLLTGDLCNGTLPVQESWCGGILVAGGRDVMGTAVSAVEVFHPASSEQNFTLTKEMATARTGHRAIALDSGRVLVVGPGATTEIYDPTSDLWAADPELRTGKHGGFTLTALLTPGGQPMRRVLVAGGRTGGSETAPPSAAAEVLYAQTAPRTWVRGPAMNVARSGHTATVLPATGAMAAGRVLVAGGSADPRAEVYSADPRAEVYTPNVPATEKNWTFTGPLQQPRARHTATLLKNGRVLVAGGHVPGNEGLVLGSAELYDPVPATWTSSPSVPSMVVPRRKHTATLLPDGKVLVVGGVGLATGTPGTPGAPTLAAAPGVEIYDPDGGPDGSWTAVAYCVGPVAPGCVPQALNRAGHTATPLKDGRVLVVGGTNPDGISARESWIYDPAAAAGAEWSSAGDPGTSFVDHTATLLDGPFCEVSSLIEQRCGNVLVAGGTARASALFNPSGHWSAATTATGGEHPDLPGGVTATFLPSGLVLAAGTNPIKNILPWASWLYDPQRREVTGVAGSARWSSGGGALDKRVHHTATLLPDGKVLVAGGTVSLRLSATLDARNSSASTSTEIFDGLSEPLDGPECLTATRLADDSLGVRLSWTPIAPGRAGGTPVTGYRAGYVELDSSGTPVKRGPSVILHDANQLTAELRGLPAKPSWTLEVAAFNEVGMGPYGRLQFSGQSSACLPLAPVDVRATARTGSATVSWSPPPDNGTTIVGYRITTRELSGRAVPAPLNAPAAPMTAELSGLNNGWTYSFTVQALASPVAAGPPSRPSNRVTPGLPLGAARVIAATGRNRSALVHWLPPPDTGGSPIISYTITAEPSEASTTVGGGTNVAVVAGLSNAVDYRFRVSASNSYGLSSDIPDLSEAVATPAPTPPAIVDGAAPSATTEVPTIESVYPRGGPVSGGGEVLISGQAFGGATEVRFGDAPPTTFRVVSQYQIVAVAPRFSAAGRVHVTVSKPQGTSTFNADAAESAYYYGEGGWAAAGFAIKSPEPLATATALPNGKILVTAGVGTRLYNPATGQWEATAEPVRAPALATVLSNGKVLAIPPGNPDCDNPAELYEHCEDVNATVSELYNPDAGTWTMPAAAAKKTGANGALAEMAGGKILVAGGCCSPDDYPYRDAGINGAETFDPATNTWAETRGRMLHARNGLTLTTLSGPDCGARCGLVLAVGGFRRPAVLGPRYGEPEPLLAPPELYDPTTGTWHSMPPMKQPRYGHTSTLLPDGRVLVVGGSTVAGGGAHYASATAEIYDPAAEEWTAIPSMPRVHFLHTATLLPSGKVLIAGGSSPAGPVAAVELYDPKSNTWAPAGGEFAPGGVLAVQLPSTGTCGVNCGKVMILGSHGDVELYTPAPVVTTVSPASAAIGAAAEVRITGSGLANESEVLIGGAPAGILVQPSHTALTARSSKSPRHSSLPVRVTTTGGEAMSAQPFVFTGGVGAVQNLTATLQGTAGVRLGFGAAGTVGDTDPPAQDYVVKQSRLPITTANFDDARSLCEEAKGVCSYEIAHSGDALNIDVGDLSPNTTYHWAVRAKVGDEMGPIATVSAVTGTVIPGVIEDLSVIAQSTRRALLSFSVTGLDGASDPPATDYIVKFSKAPITAASFDQDKLLCEPVCSFVATAVGQRVELPVDDLAAGTRYYFALRAVGHGGRLGPLSSVAEMTTVALAPGRVTDLMATPVSSGEVRLSFAAPGSPDADSPPASAYVIKQAKTPIVDLSSFDSARTLCGGVCEFSPQKVGDELSLSVTGLSPGTTYHYAVRVRHADGTVGEISNLVEATTLAQCAPVPTAGANQAAFSPGYQLLSVPSGTRISTPVLYGWFNQSSGRYSSHDPDAAETGRGYWAWFACPQLVDLAADGASSASFPLSAYHASIVGNPSSSDPAKLSGHDFAATWDPAANDGVGGYQLTGFRKDVPLAVGQAAWAFSYRDSKLSIIAY